jgi:hypothetical protein
VYLVDSNSIAHKSIDLLLHIFELNRLMTHIETQSDVFADNFFAV